MRNFPTFFSLYYYFPTADGMRASCECYKCENVMIASWLTCQRNAPQRVHHTMISADAKGASHEFCSTFFFHIFPPIFFHFFFSTADAMRASHECYDCEPVMSASWLTCECAAPQWVHHTVIIVSCECYNCANVMTCTRVTCCIRTRAMRRHNECITTADAKSGSCEFFSTFFSIFFPPTADAMRASCKCYNCEHAMSTSWLACKHDAPS